MDEFGLDKHDVHLDLTPIIDVVFLLLIFFIMATTFSKPVLEVALANAESAAVQEVPAESLTLTITDKGEWNLEGKSISAEEWEAALKASTRDTAIIFNVDKAAPFESFVGALDAAKANNRESVVINALLPSSTPAGQ